jgi:hypothetical protein
MLAVSKKMMLFYVRCLYRAWGEASKSTRALMFNIGIVVVLLTGVGVTQYFEFLRQFKPYLWFLFILSFIYCTVSLKNLMT